MPVDCFTPYDWSRSYVLPADVEANIPLGGSIGMLGAHNVARGLLVETCRYTRARPTGLRYEERALLDGAIVLDVAATLDLPGGEALTVHTRTLIRRHGDAQMGDWSITINGFRHPDQERRCPPSPPVQGWTVSHLVRQRTERAAG